jgi:putative PIN family toxin of toxin-antitoxin system
MTASEPIRAVVDTNLFVSGLLNPSGAPAALVRLLRAGRFLLVMSMGQRSELDEVLSRERLFRKYGVSRQERESLLGLLDAVAELVSESRPLPVRVRDPKDVMILQGAVDGAADYLVTGDNALLALASDRRLGGLQIVTVSVLLQVLESE